MHLASACILPLPSPTKTRTQSQKHELERLNTANMALRQHIHVLKTTLDASLICCDARLQPANYREIPAVVKRRQETNETLQESCRRLKAEIEALQRVKNSQIQDVLRQSRVKQDEKAEAKPDSEVSFLPESRVDSEEYQKKLEFRRRKRLVIDEAAGLDELRQQLKRVRHETHQKLASLEAERIEATNTERRLKKLQADAVVWDTEYAQYESIILEAQAAQESGPNLAAQLQWHIVNLTQQVQASQQQNRILQNFLQTIEQKSTSELELFLIDLDTTYTK